MLDGVPYCEVKKKDYELRSSYLILSFQILNISEIDNIFCAEHN